MRFGRTHEKLFAVISNVSFLLSVGLSNAAHADSRCTDATIATCYGIQATEPILEGGLDSLDFLLQMV
jgi:hypothetical protein